MIDIFVYRIIVASAIFLYKRVYDFYEEQHKNIDGSEKSSDEDEVEESDYSVHERDIA